MLRYKLHTRIGTYTAVHRLWKDQGERWFHKKKLISFKVGDVITSALLTGLGACSHDLALFRRVFPNGIVLTEKALREAKALGLDVHWLAYRAMGVGWPSKKNAIPAIMAKLEA